MFARSAAIFALLLSCGASLESAPAKPDRRLPTLAPYQGTSFCTFDRVMQGPSGTGIAVWKNDRRYLLGSPRIPPSVVVVGEMHDPKETSADRLFNLSGEGLRLFPIRWSTSEPRLYVRVHEEEQRVLAVSPRGDAMIAAGPLDRAWKNFALTARSHGGLEPLLDAGAIERAHRVEGRTLLRGTATLGRGLDMLAARRPSLELVRLTEAGDELIGLNAGKTRLLTALGDAADCPGGAAYLGAPRRNERNFLPYQQPVFDLASGKLAERFGPAAIELSAPGALKAPLSELQRRLLSGGRFIVDVSLSGGVLLALALAPNGDRILYRVSATGVSERPLCAPLPFAVARTNPKPPYPLVSEGPGASIAARIFSVNRAGKEASAPGLPIFILYSTGRTPGRDLFVYFHGGPGATLADELFPRSVARLLAPGRDVVAVEYSGSLGGGPALTGRLADGGIKALGEDADALAAWVRRQGYRRAWILGESFGGVPALVAIARHRALFKAGYFIAPLLRVQDPAVFAKHGSGLAQVATDTQMAYEQAYYGGPDGRLRFARALDALVASAPLTASDRFFFAELDAMSRPGHLPAKTPATQVLLPKRLHVTSMVDDAVWESILSSSR